MSDAARHKAPSDHPEASSVAVMIGLEAVIVAVTDGVPRILTVRHTDHALSPPEHGPQAAPEPPDALPFGPLDPADNCTLDQALRGWVDEQTGLPLGYVEQLYTFGDPYRDPRQRAGGPRVISVAYLALTRECAPARGEHAIWRDCYTYLPWEDWRAGRPEILGHVIQPALQQWLDTIEDRTRYRRQRERVDICFGFSGSSWDPERVLERYQILYEAGLVPEAWQNRSLSPSSASISPPGQPMALDHRRILATALGRLRGKLKYRPVVFELLPDTFTLSQLQGVVEALSGVCLHKQNFRRLVEKGGLVEDSGESTVSTGGRPARLFRFRREVLRERPAPGLRLPGGN